MKEDQIEYMVNRFLSWELPKNFSPDCGIKFDKAHFPSGTNLLDVTQAKQMVLNMLDGMPE